MEQLRELSSRLGHPSADKLWLAAQRLKLPVTRKAVFAFVQAGSARQVFKKRANYDGKIAAVKINDRWAADLIDYTAKPSASSDSGGPFQYILIVQDIFSRKIYVHALRTKTAEVCEQAFASITRKAETPARLDTDNGLEFHGPFDRYLEEENIHHEVADSRNKNARATLDAAIKQLRQQLARIQATEGHRNWASVLQRAADAYNDTVHSHLIGRAPDDVQEDKALQFDLKLGAARDLEHNDALITARARRLEQHGHFRVELPQNPFERSFHTRYSDKVHKIREVEGPWVVDEEGTKFPTRHVLGVPAHSAEINTEGMRGGSEQTDRLRLQILEPYKQRISDFLGDLGKYEHEVATYMKEIGMEPLMTQGLNYRKALRLLGFTVHGNARGSGKQLVTRPGHAAAPAAPAAPPPAAPRRMSAAMAASIGLLGPRNPAAAAAALAAPVRRRITGKQPASARP